MASAVTHCYQFTTALRGFHVYYNTVNWKPFVGQKLTFNCERNNPHDKFAVCGKTILPGKLVNSVVGHVPREIAWYIWFALQKGATLSATVVDSKPRKSHLVQGGLKILIVMTVFWTSAEKLDILRKMIETVNFHSYEDESKTLLKEMGVNNDDEDDDDVPNGMSSCTIRKTRLTLYLYCSVMFKIPGEGIRFLAHC